MPAPSLATMSFPQAFLLFLNLHVFPLLSHGQYNVVRSERSSCLWLTNNMTPFPSLKTRCRWHLGTGKGTKVAEHLPGARRRSAFSAYIVHFISYLHSTVKEGETHPLRTKESWLGNITDQNSAPRSVSALASVLNLFLRGYTTAKSDQASLCLSFPTCDGKYP